MRIKQSRPRAHLTASFAAVVVVAALVVFGRADRPAGGPSGAPTTPAASVSPGSSCDPGGECAGVPEDFVEASAPLEGTGPFLVYSTEAAEGRQVYALDVATNEAILLGSSAEAYGPPVHAQGSSLLIPLHDGAFAVLRRGSTLGDRTLRLGDYVAAVATSPDDRWVAVATRKVSDDGVARITVHPMDGSSEPRRLATFRSASDGGGGALELFWSSPQSLTVVDSCHCDGGAGYTTAYRLSSSRNSNRIAFLKDHNPSAPSPRADGAAFAFDDQPSIDCFESRHACDNVPHTLSIANVRGKTVRAVATRRAQAFESVRLSPRGSRVAAARAVFNSIEIYDVARRRRIASSWFASTSFAPAAWISESRLVALASSPDLVNDRDTGRLLLITLKPDEASIEPTTLVSGTGVRFLGLVR